MRLPLGTLLKPVFPLSAESFPKMAAERFGVQQDMDATWHTFEPVARTLVDSFHLTLDNPGHDRLVPLLDAVEPELRGIAYEGAGMGLTLLDALFPNKKRLPAFLHGPGAPYRCLVHIGAGLVLPRLPFGTTRFLARQDPFLRWLVLDGYGFHEGFFSWRKVIEERRPPRRLHGYAARAFDQGAGRSLWFSTGANVERIIATLGTFPSHRQPDLWSGIGVACAYAAGVMDRNAIAVLAEAAREYRGDLAVGTAVASVFREQSGMPAPHTDLACEVVWGTGAAEVAAVAHDAGLGPFPAGAAPAYELWRREIRRQWCARSPASSGDRGAVTKEAGA
ncbi:DUF1702 family protein [Streptomyces calidiresistens]|uniref:DUF1702 family protein n=1 Tax=Streptomyces calidiresistens TaxID=1485586 RepID=A0A7W3SZB2_9ACTN|nr:DUF1702 family protein [Streptomyces calidiresistens]MBB0227971.1 DUF1702 family protein [Streptomyces calidiresistens]